MKDDVEYFLQMLANQTKLACFWGSFEVYTNFNICTHAINAYNKCIIVPMFFFVHVFDLFQNRNEIFLKIGIGQ